MLWCHCYMGVASTPDHSDPPLSLLFFYHIMTTTTRRFMLATSMSFAFGNGLFFALSYVYLYFSRPADLPDVTAAIAAGLVSEQPLPAAISMLPRQLWRAKRDSVWPLRSLLFILRHMDAGMS